MKNSDILAGLQSVFNDFFESDAVTITENTVMEDIDEWDSVTHIQLIFEIENAFDIQFEAETIPKLVSVRQIVDAIEQLS